MYHGSLTHCSSSMVPNDLVCGKLIVQCVILVSGVDERSIKMSVQVGTAVRKRWIGIDWCAVECGQFVLASDVVGEELIRASLEHERELLYCWRGRLFILFKEEIGPTGYLLILVKNRTGQWAR